MERFEIDKDLNIPVYSEVCTLCVHLKSISKKTCDAFPLGIPVEIWNGNNKHAEIHPDQENNIVFEPANKQER